MWRPTKIKIGFNYFDNFRKMFNKKLVTERKRNKISQKNKSH